MYYNGALGRTCKESGSWNGMTLPGKEAKQPGKDAKYTFGVHVGMKVSLGAMQGGKIALSFRDGGRPGYPVLEERVESERDNKRPMDNWPVQLLERTTDCRGPAITPMPSPGPSHSTWTLPIVLFLKVHPIFHYPTLCNFPNLR